MPIRGPEVPRSRAPAQGSAGRSAHTGSVGSGHWSASNATARSRTERANGPTSPRLPATTTTPARDTRPYVGLSPKTPQSEAGTRIDPLVSEPRLSGTSPAATDAADPPDEPPAMRVGSCGLAAGPQS